MSHNFELGHQNCVRVGVGRGASCAIYPYISQLGMTKLLEIGSVIEPVKTIVLGLVVES